MRYANIPGLSKPVSRIVYGTAIPAMSRGETPFELLDAVLESGITVFDTAASYGESEAALGKWIASRGIRDQITLLTKGCRPNKWRHRVTSYDLRGDFEDSLVRLGVDSVEIYLLHRDHPEADVEPIVETLNYLYREGRVSVFGVSNWSAERISLANRYAREHGLIPFTAVSPAYSLGEMIRDPFGGSVSLNGAANALSRDWFARQGMPVFPYSSLARGFFSGKIHSGEADRAGELLNPVTAQEYSYPPNYERLRRAELLAEQKNCSVPTLAMAWLLHQPLDIYPITSPGSAAHLDEVLYSLELPLTEHECKWLNLEAEDL